MHSRTIFHIFWNLYVGKKRCGRAHQDASRSKRWSPGCDFVLNFPSPVEKPPPSTIKPVRHPHEYLCKETRSFHLCTSVVELQTDMLSIRPGHLENTTSHHHQLKGAPKTPGRQLKSGALRENAQSVHKIVLGGKQTPFRGKTRTSVLPLRRHHHATPSSNFNSLLIH